MPGEADFRTRLCLVAANPLVVVKRLANYRNDPLAQLVSLVLYEIARNLAADDIEET